jgi:cytochrome c-type biogenesis protein CcmH/NrfG
MSESKRNPVKQILIIAATCAFSATLIVPIVGMLTSPSKSSNSSQPSTSETKVSSEQLKEQAKGYENVLKKEPKNKAALIGLTNVKLQMQDYQGAIQSLEKLQALDPKNPSVLQALAQARIQTNDIKGAIASVEQLVKLYPNEASYKTVLNTLKTQAGQAKPQSQPDKQK